MKVKRFTGLFEPAVIIFMGVIVGFVAVALVSAMYGIYRQVKITVDTQISNGHEQSERCYRTLIMAKNPFDSDHRMAIGRNNERQNCMSHAKNDSRYS